MGHTANGPFQRVIHRLIQRRRAGRSQASIIERRRRGRWVHSAPVNLRDGSPARALGQVVARVVWTRPWWFRTQRLRSSEDSL